MAELLKSRALVLSSIRWHESSKIVTLYAREWGKTKVIARGALRSKSPFSGKLEALNVIDCIISQKGSRSLQIITEADLVDPLNALRLNINHMPYAFAIAELIQSLFDENQAETIFFDFTLSILNSLGLSNHPEIVFWFFLLKLSSFLGFKPNLEQCAICHQKNAPGAVHFSLEKGLIFCSDCARGSHVSLSLSETEFTFLRRLQQFPYKKIGTLELPAGISKNFTRLLLEYLNFHLDQRITLQSLTLL